MANEGRRAIQDRDHWVDIVSSPVQASQTRKKRAQVVRACDSCRQHRVKCDNHIPCSSCRARGNRCSNAAIKSTTLPQAFREIERLKSKVRELELELQKERNKPETRPKSHSPLRTTLDISHHLPSCSPDGSSWNPPWSREGIHVRAGQSMNRTWYGPSSLFYFIGRISNFLGSAFSQTDASDSDKIVGSDLASTLLDEPTSSPLPIVDDGNSLHQPNGKMLPLALDGEFLSLPQEEYFLELYWQSYHTSVLPILNEMEFREHYRSLWTPRGDVRKPSPLVDIVVAMSMQLGISTLPASSQEPILAGSDATVAGRRYYLRCQKFLAYELESPTISTLQCQLLCAVYLCCANFQNMSVSVCGTAVQTAHMLGLHLEPPDTMPSKEREMLRRLWWAVYIVDTKFSMKYGRPFLLHQPKFLPKLPNHSLEAAMQAGSSFAPLGDNITWLSFHCEQIKLFLIARAAYTTFFDQCQSTGLSPSRQDDQDVFDGHVEFLTVYMRETDEWTNSVPEALKSKRANNGRSLSTDASTLEIDPFAPLWLQRQRLLLELVYHTLCTNMYRPFISFTLTPTSVLAEQTAAKCALHAMALTRIMHQVLSSTTILTCWHETFQWQWNAAMTLVGFVLASPLSALTLDVRKTIDLSIVVLDIFGESFAVGARAANVVRQLRAKINFVVRQSSETQAALGGNKEGDNGNLASHIGRSNENAAVLDEFVDTSLEEFDSFDEIVTGSLQNTLNLAFNVDQWAEPHLLWSNMDGFVA